LKEKFTIKITFNGRTVQELEELFNEAVFGDEDAKRQERNSIWMMNKGRN
jgi:hypothetical protein